MVRLRMNEIEDLYIHHDDNHDNNDNYDIHDLYVLYILHVHMHI
jgi:hypothetical protein